MSYTNTISNLQHLLENKISLLNTEIEAEMLNGPKPSYSLKDRSFDWNGWKSEMSDEIDKLVDDIVKLSELEVIQNPYEIRMVNI